MKLASPKKYIVSKVVPVHFDAAEKSSLNLRLKGKPGGGTVIVYFSTANAPSLSEKRKVMTQVEYTGNWQDVVLPMTQSPAWQGTITGFRLDLSVQQTPLEVEAARIAFACDGGEGSHRVGGTEYRYSYLGPPKKNIILRNNAKITPEGFLSFDGGSSYAELLCGKKIWANNKGFTIAVTAKGNGTLFSKGDGLSLVLSSARYNFHVVSANNKVVELTSNAAVQTDEWNFVAVTFERIHNTAQGENGYRICLYVNGKFVDMREVDNFCVNEYHRCLNLAKARLCSKGRLRQLISLIVLWG